MLTSSGSAAKSALLPAVKSTLTPSAVLAAPANMSAALPY